MCFELLHYTRIAAKSHFSVTNKNICSCNLSAWRSSDLRQAALDVTNLNQHDPSDMTRHFSVFSRAFNAGSHRTTVLHLSVMLGCTAIGAALLWPITGGDYPPGVDTPTFLHLSWLAELAASGELSDLTQDPYWYGGFYYLVYPPLSYGLVGILSVVTGAYFVDVYIALFILAYGLMGYSVWFLSRQLGVRGWAAVIASLLVIFSYPALNAVFLWGWFTSVVALPFALISFGLLERSLESHSTRLAIFAGVFMAVATLIHHMTAAAIVMGLVIWFAYHLIRTISDRRELIRHSVVSTATSIILALPWAIPFLFVTTGVGFRREIPGNWSVPLQAYGSNVLDPGLIGVFIFPSYLGIVLSVFALFGIFLALIEGRRMAGVAMVLILLLWFSMGASANPLIKFYPFSSLDIARFHLYMTPFMAIFSGLAVQRLLEAFQGIQFSLPSATKPIAMTAFLTLILAHPVYDAWQARDLADPYRIEASVQQSLNWFADTPLDQEGNIPEVFGVGLWNWHAFLVPTLSNRPLTDGWHDEGAANVDRRSRSRHTAGVACGPKAGIAK
jgi:uncharacterized membrane protein